MRLSILSKVTWLWSGGAIILIQGLNLAHGYSHKMTLPLELAPDEFPKPRSRHCPVDASQGAPWRLQNKFLSPGQNGRLIYDLAHLTSFSLSHLQPSWMLILWPLCLCDVPLYIWLTRWSIFTSAFPLDGHSLRAGLASTELMECVEWRNEYNYLTVHFYFLPILGDIKY